MTAGASARLKWMRAILSIEVVGRARIFHGEGVLAAIAQFARIVARRRLRLRQAPQPTA
jgi:hypothetical protein